MHFVQLRCPGARGLATLLLRHTDGPSAAARRLGVLAAHAEAPVVAETTVGPDLLQALQIVTELRVDAVGEDLAALAVDDVAASVEEPVRDLVCLGCWGGLAGCPNSSKGGGVSRTVLDDGNDALQLFSSELSGTIRRPALAVLIPCWTRRHPLCRAPSPRRVIPLVEVDIGLLAGEVAESATDYRPLAACPRVIWEPLVLTLRP